MVTKSRFALRANNLGRGTLKCLVERGIPFLESCFEKNDFLGDEVIGFDALCDVFGVDEEVSI